MLHGTKAKFCNIAWQRSSKSTIQEVLKEDKLGDNNMLMQIQENPVITKETVNARVLWDSSAHIRLIRREFAEWLCLEGQLCIQHVQGAGKEARLNNGRSKFTRFQ